MNTSTLLNSSSPAQTVGDGVPAPQYAIAANATLQERRTRTLKHGDTFAVFDQRGDIGGEPGNSEGLYYRDTRILSQFQVLLEEARPLLLSSMTQDDNAVFSADLSNPDLLIDGRIAFRREQIHLNRLKFVWQGACYERLLVRNFSDGPLHVRLTFRFASDFADLFEVRGEVRAAHGASSADLESGSGVLLKYGVSTAGCEPPATRCANRVRAPRASTVPIPYSTKSCAAACPICTCSSPTRRLATIRTPARRGSAPPSDVTDSSPP